MTAFFNFPSRHPFAEKENHMRGQKRQVVSGWDDADKRSSAVNIVKGERQGEHGSRISFYLKRTRDGCNCVTGRDA